MADKLMCIPNNEAQNYSFCRLKLVVETFEQNSLNSPKLFSKRIRKRYYKTLGTSVIDSPMSPSSLTCMHLASLEMQLHYKWEKSVLNFLLCLVIKP